MIRRPRWSPPAAALMLPLLFLVAARAEEPAPLEESLAVARRAAAGIVRLQWRSAAAPDAVLERHAVVVDEDGWLVMAGPPVSRRGTLVARFDGDRAMRADVWATDARTGLTLLHVPVGGLAPLRLLEVEDPDGADDPPPHARAPRRLPPGARFTMATAEGAIARGTLRASHRDRHFADPDGGEPWAVEGLDEGAVAVVPRDLGAPWLDAEGRVIGLLAAGRIETPLDAAPPPGTSVRPEVVAAYAVPGSVVATVWPLLKAERRVPRAALGILVRPASEALRHHLCPGCGAHEVIEVAEGGPAERARVRPMDVVLSIDGLPLAPGATLASALLPYRPGDTIRVGVLRRGERIELPVLLMGAAR